MNPSAETVGSIEYRASINTAELKRDAADVDRITKDVGDKTGRNVEQGTERAGQAYSKLKTVATVALVGVGVAGVALARRAIKSATDLGESYNAVEKTFGEASSTIFEFGKVADKAAGLSKAAFHSAVVPIGAMLRNMGQDANSAADYSVKLAQRAADLASVFNTDLGEALTAIQAGLRGEADPLERFGVGLSETAVQAYAVESGLIKAGKEMTAQQKTVSRLGLLFKQTERYAGDFVDTSDQAANRSRILSARYENLSATVGQKLMPAYEKALSAGEYLVNNVDGIVSGVRTALVPIAGLAAGVAAYTLTVNASAIALRAYTIAQIAMNTAMMSNPLGLIIGSVAALGAVLLTGRSQTDANATATNRLNEARMQQRVLTEAARNAEINLKNAQLDQEGAALRVESAQRAYNQAVANYGPKSLEAREAGYQLKRSQLELKSAQDETKRSLEDLDKKQAEVAKNRTLIGQLRETRGELDGITRSADGAVTSINKLADKAKATKSTGVGGQKIDLTPLLKAPGRAAGGSVSAGQPYFVGENRDGSLNRTSELFVPRQSGQIVNSRDLQASLGGGGTQIENNIQNVWLASDVDADRFIRRLTNDAEALSNGLIAPQAYGGAAA